MSSTLFLIGQDGTERGWYPVGRLRRADDQYEFVYTNGLKKLQNFSPFGRLKDRDVVYRSSDLFPLFSNRLLGKTRPEYEHFLRWAGINPVEDDPLLMLAVTEGLKRTDGLLIYKKPEPDELGRYNVDFFVHGLRYLPSQSNERLSSLVEGNRLYVMRDAQNSFDRDAVALRAEAPSELMGYVPRFMARDVCELLQKSDGLDPIVTIRRVNADAPVQMRLLCNMGAKWPKDFNPCGSEDFEPYTKDLVAGLHVSAV